MTGSRPAGHGRRAHFPRRIRRHRPRLRRRLISHPRTPAGHPGGPSNPARGTPGHAPHPDSTRGRTGRSASRNTASCSTRSRASRTGTRRPPTSSPPSKSTSSNWPPTPCTRCAWTWSRRSSTSGMFGLFLIPQGVRGDGHPLLAGGRAERLRPVRPGLRRGRARRSCSSTTRTRRRPSWRRPSSSGSGSRTSTSAATSSTASTSG